METSNVCIQFTGGKDSTLTAALMAQQFEKVHLLSFRNPLIVDLDKTSLNVEKLQHLYGKDKFKHAIIDNEKLLRQIYTGRWLQDLIKYRTYAANNFCGPCRLSMVTHTIIYCLQRKIAFVRDGANRTGFDLAQQTWGLRALRKFYKEYNIDYDCTVYRTPSSLSERRLPSEHD
jgi:PP-loop superfamily ATP-utilizing enzyme